MSGPLPVPGLRGLSAYKVPVHPAPVDLILSGNEGPLPPVDLAGELLRFGTEPLRRYPDARALTAILARRFELTPERVLVTAGADDALDRAFRAFLAPGDTVVLPSPTFVMMPHYARLIGATMLTPAWPAAEFPVDAVEAALETRPKALALVSPNNPTGAAIPTATLLALAARSPETLVMVDFAYVEMADEDPTAALLALPNVLVFRTLSKAWGLAGLRVGYVLGDPRLIAVLRAAGPPYSVTAASLIIAERHLAAHEPAMRAYVDTVRKERVTLYDALARVGTRPVPSAANFVFTRCQSPAQAVWLRDGLASLGIGVRAFPGDPWVDDGVRITCPGDPEQTERLTHAIESVLAPHARIDKAEGLFGLGRPAWFLAKDIAEVHHARRLGAVPIALGDPNGANAHALLAAGAARVAPSFEALEATIV
jgi:histidinol-phosphate aminotransferase